MKGFYVWLTVATVMLVPLYSYHRMSEDMTQREVLNDWLHSPKVAFWSFAIVGVMAVATGCYMVHIVRSLTRREREIIRIKIELMEQERQQRGE